MSLPGQTITIPLQSGLSTIIDAEDLSLIQKYTGWYAHKSQNGKFYVRGYDPAGYIPILRKQKAVKMHRVIMRVNDPKVFVDHKNHNGLDNTKLNLRLCNQSQNQQNRSGAAKNSASKYLGVSLHKRKNGVMFTASIRLNGKSKTLGRFKSDREAALKYNEAATIHFGEFASLNKL
jgi:hypothetical protein